MESLGEVNKLKSWSPDMNQTKWIETNEFYKYLGDPKFESSTYYKYIENPEIELKITDEIIDESKLYVLSAEKQTTDNIYIYIEYNDGINKKITHTQKGFYESIISNIYYYYIKLKIIKCTKEIKTSIFDIFSDIRNVKCRIVGILRGNIISSHLKMISELYNKKNKILEKKVQNDEELYTTNELIKYYIVSINDANTRKYIYGTIKEPTDEDILMVIDDNYLNIENAEYEIIDELEVSSIVDGLIKVDEYIEKNNTINNGLNLFFNVKDEEIFIMKQQEIMNNIYNNNETSEKLCYIEYKKEKYIFKSKKGHTIKDTLNYMYNMRLDTCNDEYKSIIKLFEKVKFIDLKIGIIKKNIDLMKIDILFEYYRNRLTNNTKINTEKVIKQQKRILTPQQKYVIFKQNKN